ncbi:ABC transporter ATP-binding protein [Roseateles chitinivorans]|uniref:ABC transporter ATP-binding protein n=1 Tax=Roseateles chitinivorans TaxID=2917965 RepID=UPI003D6743C2
MSGCIDPTSAEATGDLNVQPGDPVIEVRHVGTVLGGVRIHKDLSLEVTAGEVLAIIGGSGSGKTTLLRLMLGLERPSEGEVLVFGHKLGKCEATDLAQVRHRWGVLFQQGALFSALSVFDNVALPLRELKSLPKDLIAELVMTKLQQVGLKAEDGIKMPAELSGGMIKRVSLARSLIMDPQLLFLDEPTAGLDPASSKNFVQLIEKPAARDGADGGDGHARRGHAVRDRRSRGGAGGPAPDRARAAGTGGEAEASVHPQLLPRPRGPLRGGQPAQLPRRAAAPRRDARLNTGMADIAGIAGRAR